MKLGYLGPKGTFSEQAALAYAGNLAGEVLLEQFSTIYDVICAVETGDVQEGIVPFENSIEGIVTNTIDTLIFDVNLWIKAEVTIPIAHSLLVQKDYAGEPIQKIFSHPQALAQCRKFIREKFGNVEVEPVSSTAASAEIVSKGVRNWAGIGTRRAGELFGLRPLYQQIQDENHNATRFLVVSKKAPQSADLCNKKASIVFSTMHKPGELYKILDIISIWDLNMTKIESRPMRNQMGKYVFLIDLEVNDAGDFHDALKMIERKTSFFKNLGVYDIIKPMN